MENGEDFWVMFYNGSSWQTVAVYSAGTSFSNGNFYAAEITLNSSDYDFATNSGFAFQCDASGNYDYIYIDAVSITGINGSKVANNTVMKIDGVSGARINTAWNEGLLVYPNPVRDVLNVNFDVSENTKAEIYTIKGALIKTVELVSDKTQIPVDDLKPGVYVLRVKNSEESVNTRFIKK